MTDELLEALEAAVANAEYGSEWMAQRGKRALPLARQLIEERDFFEDACRQEQERHASTLRDAERYAAENQGLREENKRLRDEWRLNSRVWESKNLDLQSRLSAAEDYTKADDERINELASEKRAAEKQIEVFKAWAEDYKAQKERAEEVVEAAKAYVADEDCLVPGLHEAMEHAIRRYEEGKDASTTSPVVLP